MAFSAAVAQAAPVLVRAQADGVGWSNSPLPVAHMEHDRAAIGSVVSRRKGTHQSRSSSPRGGRCDVQSRFYEVLRHLRDVSRDTHLLM